MDRKRVWRSTPLRFAGIVLVLWCALPGQVHSQGRGVPASPPTARAAAPVDLTGYWISVVTEDWRYRMVTAPKGDFAGIPLNAEGRRVGELWDPVKDEAAGEHCKSYGAPAVMRIPGRVHITWNDANSLKVETEAGSQTRLLHFDKKVAGSGQPSWQGYSFAQWQYAGGRGPGAEVPAWGKLKVITTNLRPGYLRKNGPPYSSYALLTEYYARTIEPNGDSWLIVTTVVEDPTYLNQRFVTSTHFKKLRDGNGWSHIPCTVR